MKNISFVLCVLLLLGTASDIVSRNRKTAQMHNEEGMKFYRDKKFTEAALSFRKAIEADSGHKLANYNLACMYALIIQCGQIDIEDSKGPMGIETIYRQLARAYELDPNVKKKAPNDDDLKSLRHSSRFWAAIGYDLNDAKLARRILSGSSWYTGECSGGAYGCASIEFMDDGSFVYHPVGPDCGFDDRISAEECETIKRNNRGRYKIDDSTVILKYNSGIVEKYSLPDSSGNMKQRNGNKNLGDEYPDPCSA